MALNRFRLGFAPGGSKWTPFRLLAGNDGFIFHLSDFSRLFQDADALTPVTAVGQTVRRINDANGGAAYSLVEPAGLTLQQYSWGGYYLTADGTNNYLTITGATNFERQALSVVLVGSTTTPSSQKIYFTRSAGGQGFSWQQESGNLKLYADPDLVDSTLALPTHYNIRQIKLVSSGAGNLVFGLDAGSASTTALSATTLVQPYEGLGRSTETTYRMGGDFSLLLAVGKAIDSTDISKVKTYYRNVLGVGYGQIIMDGNSLTAGSGVGATENYPYQLAELLGALKKQYKTYNYGVGGQTTPDMISDAVAQIDPLVNTGYQRNLLVAWEGTNDLYYAATAQEAYDNLVTYCQARRSAGYTVAIMTILPRSDAGLPGSFETSRQTVNTNIRTNWATFADTLLDIAADTRIGDAGDELDGTYYNMDKVHLTAAGHTIVAELVRDWVITL